MAIAFHVHHSSTWAENAAGHRLEGDNFNYSETKTQKKREKKSQSHLPTEIECQQRQNKEINADIPKPNNSKHSTNYVDELFQYNTTCRR